MVNYKKMVSRPGNHFKFYLHTKSKLSSKKECTHEKMSTKELSNELKKQEGIISITVEPYEKIEVGGIRVDGPAVILINQE